MRFLSRKPVLAFLIASFCSFVPATTEATRWIVVSSANAPGLNETKWLTDLTVVNPADAEAAVKVSLLERGKDNGSLSTNATIQVPAHGQTTVPNALGTLFEKEGSGALLLESSSAAVQASTRTYNQLADRSYGMYLPALTDAEILSAGETAHIIFVARSARYRTNIIYVNASSTRGSITVTLYDKDNQKLGEPVTKELLPHGQDQFDAFGPSSAPATSAARAEVTADVPFAAMSTVIDEKTGDPFAVVARRETIASVDLILPAAVHADGDKNARFRSDLRAFNPSGDPATVTFAFFPRGESTSVPETKPMTVSARGLAAIDDILLSLFEKNGAAGAIRVTSTRPLMVMSVTYNDDPVQGTSGQDLPAIPAGQLIQTGDVARLSTLLGGDFRTNIIFFNPGDAALDAELLFRSPSGAEIVKKTITMKARTMDQINKLLEDFFKIDANTTGFRG